MTREERAAIRRALIRGWLDNRDDEWLRRSVRSSPQFNPSLDEVRLHLVKLIRARAENA
jgi:hypothetical protein